MMQAILTYSWVIFQLSLIRKEIPIVSFYIKTALLFGNKTSRYSVFSKAVLYECGPMAHWVQWALVPVFKA